MMGRTAEIPTPIIRGGSNLSINWWAPIAKSFSLHVGRRAGSPNNY